MARMNISCLSLEQLMAYRELSKKLDDGLFDDWNELVSSKAIRQYTEAYRKEHSIPLLQLATDTENLELAESLVEDNPNCVNEMYCDNRTPLMLTTSLDIAKILVENGADINAIMYDGTSVLMYHMKQYESLLRNGIPKAIETAQRIREIIIFLLENGVKLIPRDGKMALNIAKEVEDEELVKLIKMYMKK